jgi:hypothetical protein
MAEFRRSAAPAVISAGRTPTKNTAHPPTGTHDDGGHDDCRAVADGPRTLDEAERLAPMLGGPGLGDERRATGPLATHAEPEQDAEQRQLPDGPRQAAGAGEHGVDQDAADERACAPVSIGDHAEEDAADRRGRQRQRSQQPARRFRHPEIAHQRRQHERVQHDVERIEPPAERGGDERTLRIGRRLAPPAEEPRCVIRFCGCHFAIERACPREILPCG